MGLKLKKFNAVNDNLPQDLDNNLQAFAQETGQISYTDIMNFKGDAEKYKKLRYHLNKWNEYIESGQDDKALKKSDDIRAMIKGQKEFGFGKKTWHIFALDIEGGSEIEVGTGDYTSKDEAEMAWNEIANEADQKYSNPKFRCYSKKHSINLKKFSTDNDELVKEAKAELNELKSKLNGEVPEFYKNSPDDWEDMKGQLKKKVDNYEVLIRLLSKFKVGDHIRFKEKDAFTLPSNSGKIESFNIGNIPSITVKLDRDDNSLSSITHKTIHNLGSIREFSTSEIAAVVLKNADGTHEVISIEDESDEERVKSYVEDEGATVVKRCKDTKEADEYIESKKLKRAYSESYSHDSIYVVLQKANDGWVLVDDKFYLDEQSAIEARDKVSLAKVKQLKLASSRRDYSTDAAGSYTTIYQVLEKKTDRLFFHVAYTSRAKAEEDNKDYDDAYIVETKLYGSKSELKEFSYGDGDDPYIADLEEYIFGSQGKIMLKELFDSYSKGALKKKYPDLTYDKMIKDAINLVKNRKKDDDWGNWDGPENRDAIIKKLEELKED